MTEPARTNEPTQVVVAGHLVVDPDQRESYLDGCRVVVDAARVAEGCLDFAISADLVDPARINIFERWASRAAVDAFRGDGIGDDQSKAIRDASVMEMDTTGQRTLL